MLANVMAKPYKVIFHGICSAARRTPTMSAVRATSSHHLGTSTDREFGGASVHMSLVPNPSHLEAADPVVLGKVRQQQQVVRDDLAKARAGAARADPRRRGVRGAGIVWECLGFSGIRGYNTEAGCIHFIVNNQIGFTTSPQFARSSPYPSDVAKGVMAPILHVNGDDPEAVTFACKLAIDFRQQFKRDVVIDMWCYRRFGHNEGDEPSFTQPLMYAVIRQHPPVSQPCAAKLEAEGVIDAGWADARRAEFVARLEGDFEAAKSYKPNKADWFAGRWSGLHAPADPENARRNISTGVSDKLFDSIGRTLTTIPDDVEVHKTLRRVIDARGAMFADKSDGEVFDWATAESLAFGTLLSEGYQVRLSGQIRVAAPSASATPSGSTRRPKPNMSR